jgi:hypothetical protein
MEFLRAAQFRGSALTLAGRKARRTRRIAAAVLAMFTLALLDLRFPPAHAADGIALFAWSASVRRDRSVTISVTTSGGGGLVSHSAWTASHVGYECVVATTGVHAYGSSNDIGKEDLVGGDTYEIGPFPPFGTFPTLDCHMNAAYLYGDDGSSSIYKTAGELAAAGLSYQFTIPA